MTKLRSRLLVTLILAAVMLSAVGPGVARADSNRQSGSRTSAPWSSPTVRPLSGEPDAGGLSSPTPKSSPTWVAPLISPWVLELWIKWLHVEKASSGSFHRSL